MRESVQKSNVTKPLFPIFRYTLNCSSLRCVLAILAVCLWIASSSWADYNKGWAAYERGDYTTALREWRPLAEQGNAHAQDELGWMYSNGYGVGKDYGEAVKWYRRAAEQGEADGQFHLGWMYSNGYGVGKDYGEAVKWLRKAAEQGNVLAYNTLGVIYYNGGYGVGKDYGEAVKWYRRAAEQGNVHAYSNLGAVYYNGGYGVGKDYGEAVKWLRRAAEQGNATACNALGAVYYNGGYGVGKDYVSAYMWFSLAAARGDDNASKNQKLVAKQLTSAQIAEARRSASARNAAVQSSASARNAAIQSSASARNAAVQSSASARNAAIQSSASARNAAVQSSTSARNAEARRKARNWKRSKEQAASTSKPNPQREQPSTPTPALPPILSIEDIALSKGVLNAAETTMLSIRIKNVGPGDAHNLSVKLASTLPSLVFPASTTVPTIPKQGGEKTVKIRIRGTLELPTGTATLDIRLSESKFKLEIPGKRLRFETRQFQNPELVLANAVVLEGPAAVPNNRIDLNEMIDLRFYVQNRGSGPAENVRVTVENSQVGVMWVGVASEKGIQREHPTFATIAAGKYELVTYSYLVNSEFTDSELRFNIRATERHGRWGFTGTKVTAINTALAPLGTITELPREDNTPRQRPRIEELPALEIDVRKDIPETSTKNRNAVAVVIGNKHYTKPGVPDVVYAENDALIVKEYLIHTLGYSEENIHYHIDATKGVFEEVFGNQATHQGRLYDYVESDGSSDVFIYYSGHGAPDMSSKEPYLVPTDANPSAVEVSGYALKLLYRNLKKVPYRHAMVVIDSCFSGMSASGGLIPGAKGYGIPSIEIPLLPPEKSVIFTATNKRQVANGYKDKQHSLFTYFFLKALWGAAEASGDARLTVSEISAYVNKQVPRMSRRIHGSSREQTPQVVGNENLVIVRY